MPATTFAPGPWDALAPRTSVNVYVGQHAGTVWHVDHACPRSSPRHFTMSVPVGQVASASLDIWRSQPCVRCGLPALLAWSRAQPVAERQRLLALCQPLHHRTLNCTRCKLIRSFAGPGDVAAHLSDGRTLLAFSAHPSIYPALRHHSPLNLIPEDTPDIDADFLHLLAATNDGLREPVLKSPTRIWGVLPWLYQWFWPDFEPATLIVATS